MTIRLVRPMRNPRTLRVLACVFMAIAFAVAPAAAFADDTVVATCDGVELSLIHI